MRETLIMAVIAVILVILVTAWMIRLPGSVYGSMDTGWTSFRLTVGSDTVQVGIRYDGVVVWRGKCSSW